jgi:hypothetical protein
VEHVLLGLLDPKSNTAVELLRHLDTDRMSSASGYSPTSARRPEIIRETIFVSLAEPRDATRKMPAPSNDSGVSLADRLSVPS